MLKIRRSCSSRAQTADSVYRLGETGFGPDAKKRSGKVIKTFARLYEFFKKQKSLQFSAGFFAIHYQRSALNFLGVLIEKSVDW